MWWWRAAVGLVVVGLLTGCEVGDIRRPAPVRASATPATIDVRRALVPVPGDFSLQVLAFVNDVRGYALYTRCESACEAVLLATVDGGRSWELRHHPSPVAANQQMIVGDSGEVMLLAEPHGWYHSTDGGRSFQRLPYRTDPPAEYYQMSGRFQLWESDHDHNRVVEYAGGHRRELATQPPLAQRITDVEYDPAGRLWAVALESGWPVVALSRDAGRTWQRQPVPGAVGWLVGAWLEVSPGGGDVWLLGLPEPGAFPRLWRYGEGGWLEQPARGHPAQMHGSAALGDGVLVIARPGGGGLVDRRGYTASSWPLDGSSVRVLRDGTLMTGRAGDGVFLGVGHGVDRRWVHITLQSS